MCSPDGQEIAKALLKLDADGRSGWFEPHSASLILHSLDANTYPELLADLGTHRHKLLNVRRLLDKEWQPALTQGPFGEIVVNQRFYFDVQSEAF